MSAAWEIVVDGPTDLNLEGLSKNRIQRVMAASVNRVARDARAETARRVREQVNLPVRYLAPSGERLVVAQKASQSNPTAIIRARSRPTSLAQYVRGKPKPSVAGVYLEVAPGRVRFMSRAFLIRLRSGSQLTDTKFNMGLAIRLKPGETLSNKTNFTRTKDGLYLLYGPSIDQLFLSNDGSGIASDLAPKLAEDLRREFTRLIEV